MGVMYLKEDHTGPASRIEFGKKGDKVEARQYYETLWLAEGRNGKFYIRRDLLSETPVQPDKVIAEPVKKKRK